MLHLKKTKDTCCRYHYQNLDDMIHSSWDIEQNKLKLVVLGLFLPFIPLKTPNIKILKNEKICWSIILHMCTKNHNHMICSSWDMEKNFLLFWALFCPFTSAPPLPSIPLPEHRRNSRTLTEHWNTDRTLKHWRNNRTLTEKLEYHGIVEHQKSSRITEQQDNTKKCYQYGTMTCWADNITKFKAIKFL